ncbi:MAG: hypothetical protein PVH03_06210 [Chloroflexota bacterium]|jgi:hypothetical protein
MGKRFRLAEIILFLSFIVIFIQLLVALVGRAADLLMNSLVQFRNWTKLPTSMEKKKHA